MATQPELHAMRCAIALSVFGRGTTSPNPPVGCVILTPGGDVVGTGYHLRKGEPHAEAIALDQAGQRAQGGTAVVTLEPCTHHGRTPPCRQALIDAGITRVVIAHLDPTSRGEGGATHLRTAGIDVEIGVLADESALVLGPWLTALTTHRPEVHLAYAHNPHDHTTSDIPGISNLTGTADAVLWPNGHLTEGTFEAHRTDEFHLPSTLPTGSPRHILGDLYDDGVRSLLMIGPTRTTDVYLTSQLVDRLTIYLPPEPSQPPTMPVGFGIRALHKLNGAVCIELRRTTTATGPPS